jgi:salicylate hydroxylase
MDFGDVKEDEELIVHRDSLLRELLAPLPNDILHPSKKLIGIDGTGEAIGISFTDGTSNEFDVVIGADGVFSLVRDHVLQDRQKAFAATPGGFWDCRILVPFDKAKATLGKELFELHRQYCWFGEIAFIMHDVLENGTLVQCVISAVEREAPKDRRHVLTRESLTETLKDGKEVQSRMELSMYVTFLLTYMAFLGL